MIKAALAELGLGAFAVIGLVVFIAVFVGILVWTLSRSRRQVDRWASLPLADGIDPVEPRDYSKSKEGHGAGHHESDGCGKCETCTCAPPELTTITTFTTPVAH